MMEQRRKVNYMKEREEINAVGGIRDNRRRIQAGTIVCSTLSSPTRADKTGLNH